jgi:hypothetical protein
MTYAMKHRLIYPIILATVLAAVLFPRFGGLLPILLAPMFTSSAFRLRVDQRATSHLALVAGIGCVSTVTSAAVLAMIGHHRWIQEGSSASIDWMWLTVIIQACGFFVLYNEIALRCRPTGDA